MKYFSLIRANLGRNKLRTALTAGAIMLAVALVCMLLTMPAGMDAMLASMTSNTRISVHNKAGLVYSMPYAFTRKVRQVDGVAAAMSMTWFGGAFEEDGRVTFPNFAVEPEHVGEVYPDYKLDPQQLADFQRYRDGAMVGRIFKADAVPMGMPSMWTLAFGHCESAAAVSALALHTRWHSAPIR